MNQDPHRGTVVPRFTTIRVLPVLDLRAGQPVHARGGQRERYRPVQSLLYQGNDPIELPLAFRERLGLSEFYLADLDAIEGGLPDLGFLQRAVGAGFRVWVDAGIRDISDLVALQNAGAAAVIAATETLSGPTQLQAIQEAARPGSVVFGLDLRAGRTLLAAGSSWRSDDSDHLIDEALTIGIRRILVLDSARVGSGEGIGTLPIVNRLIRRAPGAEITVGGGIAGKDDLLALADLGVSAALVGSALHDGRIGRLELREICGQSPARLVDR